MALGEQMLILGGVAKTAHQAREKLCQVLDSGAGLEKFVALVRQQGGDPRVVDEPGLLPRGEIHLEVNSPQEGFINRIDAREVGAACVQLGAGRMTLEDSIDPAVGVLLRKKVGRSVTQGEVLAEVLASDADKGRRAVEQILAAVEVGLEKPDERALVIELIGGEEEAEGSKQ
jgi:thymidine phosphorylase